MENAWELREFDESAAAAISRHLGISRLTACLLVQRGINNITDARDFLCGGLDNLSDPLEMRGVAEAVERIKRALADQEKIVIYGDYDADGVCSIVILQECLELLGGQVDYYVPNRFNEGYGLNRESLEILAGQGCRLLITVDCGISSLKEVELAASMGMDVIITDHHNPPPVQPDALAVINPKNDRGKTIGNLAGAGVAFKLASALVRGTMPSEDIYRWLELVALATVADVVPLIGENRIMVKYGLQILEKTRRPGLRALIRDTGLEGKAIQSWQIGYVLAPRLNSAGRMESARSSIELLLSSEAGQALQLAARLGRLNNERRLIEETIYKEALSSIERDARLAESPILVIGGERWHQGVIGIVASRLAEKYNRPAIVISWEGDAGKGSGRSVDGFNLYNALEQTRDYLTGFGGHKMAAGININRAQLSDFEEALQRCRAGSTIEPGTPRRLVADMEIEETDINQRLMEEIEFLSPFGEGNPVPRFVLRARMINNPVRVGTDRAHLKFTTGPENIEGIIFNRTDIEAGRLPKCSQDLLFELDRNDFGGKKRLQLKVKDIKSSFGIYGSFQEDSNSVRLARAARRAVEEIRAGRPVLFVYPAYRSLIKHQAVMEYFFSGPNLAILHGCLSPGERNRLQNQLAAGAGKVFLITGAFLRYLSNKQDLPGNLRYMVRMWAPAYHAADGIDFKNIEIEALEQTSRIVLCPNRQIVLDRGNTLIYANQPRTIKHFHEICSSISIEAGVPDMKQRRAARRNYALSPRGIMVSDGTHTAGWPDIGKINDMILADSPLGFYELASYTDYMQAEKDFRVEVAFAQKDLSVNRRYLDRLYPDARTASAIIRLLLQYEGKRKGLEPVRLAEKIGSDCHNRYGRLEILAGLRILADLDLCRIQKSGSIMAINSDDAQNLVTEISGTPYYMEGLAEKEILAEWEMELKKALVW